MNCAAALSRYHHVTWPSRELMNVSVCLVRVIKNNQRHGQKRKTFVLHDGRNEYRL